MVYADKLSDTEAAKVLQGFDVTEAGHWIQQLHWGRWESCEAETTHLCDDLSPAQCTHTVHGQAFSGLCERPVLKYHGLFATIKLPGTRERRK